MQANFHKAASTKALRHHGAVPYASYEPGELSEYLSATMTAP